MDKESKERYIDGLYKHREFLEQTRITLAASFDKYLLMFSSGSLYLSIFFTNSLDGGCLRQKEWLGSGWALLIVSIVSMLLSIYFSVKAHEVGVNIDDDIIDDVRDDKEARIPENFMNGVVSVFEIIGGVAFVLGIISLSYFYFSNLK